MNGMGVGDEMVAWVPMLVQTAVRACAGPGALTGPLSAGLLLPEPGRADAVGVLAVVRPDGSGNRSGPQTARRCPPRRPVGAPPAGTGATVRPCKWCPGRPGALSHASVLVIVRTTRSTK